MRFSVEKLRWGLLVGGGSLLLLLVGLLGYSRYRAVRAWKSVLARSGATLTRETNGFTYSQSLGGRTVFTLHAAKAVQAKDGKYALHDVSLLLYRQAQGPPDRIYGSEFEYDDKSGVARALGEVQMDLQAPGALHHSGTNGGATRAEVPAGLPADQRSEPHEPESEPETVHVKTSGLVYVRKLGVAATDQDVEFRYGAMQCHARGAEFDSEQSTVHLLSDVQMNGEVRGTALTLIAARADLDRNANVATLSRPEMRSQEGSAGSATAVLHLTASGLVQSAEASGEVHATRGTESLHAARAVAELSPESTLREARFSGGVTFADENKAQPMQGHAQAVLASFGPHGAPRSVIAEGDVFMQAIRASSGASGPGSLRREISGQRVETQFAAAGDKAKPALRELKIDGQAHLSGESYVQAKAEGSTAKGVREQAPKPGGLARTQVSADALLVTFVPGPSGRPQPETLTGTGRTAIEQALPGGAARRSTGDRLSMRFTGANEVPFLNTGPRRGVRSSAAEVQLTYAVQEGHATLRSVSWRGSHAASKPGERPSEKPSEEVTEGTAQRVEFDDGKHRVSLAGQAHLWSVEDDLTATRVDLDSDTGDAQAEGPVRVTLVSGTSHEKAPVAAATHIAASQASFLRASNVAEFHGTATEPVRLWQGGSQLEAAIVVVDRVHNSLSARPQTADGLIRAVFVGGRPGAEKPGEQERVEKATVPKATAAVKKQATSGDRLPPAGSALLVTSSRLEYSGLTREATFSGGVRTNGALGEARSQTAVVFLWPIAREAQPGEAKKTSETQRAPAEGLLGGAVEKVVLAGKVQMEQPGRYGSGEQLLYTAATSSFVLTGAPGRPPRIVDAAQGSVTGTTLLFRTGDNTVVVAGDSARTAAATERVRTELNLHP